MIGFTTGAVDYGPENDRSNSKGYRSKKRTNWTATSSGNVAKIPKILFPSFDGTNPRNWIRKCKKYFNINPMSDEQKLDMVSIHLEGRADVWYHDYQESNATITWDQFMLDVCNRFLEGGHDNIIGEFNKLRQTGSVEEYHESFEELKAFMVAKHRSLDEDYYIKSFVSGLKEEVAKMVQLLSPTTLTQAIYMAKMQEGLLEASQKKSKTPLKPYNYPTSYSTPPSKSYSTPKSTLSTPNTSSHTKNANSSTSPSFTTNSTPIKKLSYAEMRSRKEKGLCYNCDETFKPGHKCKQQQLFMLALEEENDG